MAKTNADIEHRDVENEEFWAGPRQWPPMALSLHPG